MLLRSALPYLNPMVSPYTLWETTLTPKPSPLLYLHDQAPVLLKRSYWAALSVPPQPLNPRGQRAGADALTPNDTS